MWPTGGCDQGCTPRRPRHRPRGRRRGRVRHRRDGERRADLAGRRFLDRLPGPAPLADRLLAQLFPGDGDEHGAMLAAGIARSPRGIRLLGRELFLARDGKEYVPGERGYRMLAGAFVTEKILHCRNEKLCYLATHTTAVPTPSPSVPPTWRPTNAGTLRCSRSRGASPSGRSSSRATPRLATSGYRPRAAFPLRRPGSLANPSGGFEMDSPCLLLSRGNRPELQRNRSIEEIDYRWYHRSGCLFHQPMSRARDNHPFDIGSHQIGLFDQKGSARLLAGQDQHRHG